MKRIFDLELGAVRILAGIMPGLKTIIRRVPDGWIFYEARVDEDVSQTEIVSSTFIQFSDRRKKLETDLDLSPLEDRRGARHFSTSITAADSSIREEALQTDDALALLQLDDLETKNPLSEFSAISISDAEPSEIASKIGGAPMSGASLLPPARYWAQILERLHKAGYSVKKVDRE